MSDTLLPVLSRLASGETLTSEEATTAFETILGGEATPAQIGAFLMGLCVRGETIDEITAGAQVLRRHMAQVEAPEDALDTCGTGGDGAGTYNISTAAALVAAACGARIAKHGNRAMSSQSGASDVLEALGVNLDLSPEAIAHCIAEAGLGFMTAPAHHTAMRHAAPVRRELRHRTIFNLLGPLANPAGVKRQVLGVFAEKWVEPLAHVLHRLGSTRAWVVHGTDGLDELTTTGASVVAELRDGKVRVFEATPEDAGPPRAAPADLTGGTAQENAAALTALLDGASGAYRDIVLLNAAAALCVADKAEDLRDGATQAAAAIDDGRARDVLARLIELSS